jgi:hypothetical protein
VLIWRLQCNVALERNYQLATQAAARERDSTCPAPARTIGSLNLAVAGSRWNGQGAGCQKLPDRPCRSAQRGVVEGRLVPILGSLPRAILDPASGRSSALTTKQVCPVIRALERGNGSTPVDVGLGEIGPNQE